MKAEPITQGPVWPDNVAFIGPVTKNILCTMDMVKDFAVNRLSVIRLLKLSRYVLGGTGVLSNPR